MRIIEVIFGVVCGLFLLLLLCFFMSYNNEIQHGKQQMIKRASEQAYAEYCKRCGALNWQTEYGFNKKPCQRCGNK